MEIFKKYEKWKTIIAPPGKRKKEQASSLSDSSDSDNNSTFRPVGNKKQKAMASLEAKANKWMMKIADNTNADTNDRLVQMMEEKRGQEK